MGFSSGGFDLQLHGQPIHDRFGLLVFPAVLSRAHLVRALAERGLFDEGAAHGQEAIQIAETLDHPFSIVWGCLDLVYLEGMKGELGQVAHLLERAVAQCRDWNIMIYTPIAMAALGYLYAWSGRVVEGITCLQQALTTYESTGMGYFHSHSVQQLGEAYLLADHVENARACADRAVTLARERGERGFEAWALRLLGEIASHHDSPDMAMAGSHYGAAMTLASELEMRPLVAHYQFGLGRLNRRTGKREQAKDHLNTAKAMQSEMDMRFWLNQVHAELKGLG